MIPSLAVLFSFNEAVVMVAVFVVLFGLPIWTIFKRMKMEDRRLEMKKKLHRKPPSKPTDPPNASSPSPKSSRTPNRGG